MGANPYYRTYALSATPQCETKRNETNLVGITADARHTTDAKIKRSQLVATIFALCKAGLFEERNDE